MDLKLAILNREHGQSGLNKCRKSGFSGFVPSGQLSLIAVPWPTGLYPEGIGVGRWYTHSLYQNNAPTTDKSNVSHTMISNFFFFVVLFLFSFFFLFFCFFCVFVF